ncbi:hypothetical protein O1611_g2563 [Lasiodiplodia mahajangana]|uniref:Uncharacterized protein n=1 Tax=Lasiodiplodia mahajangana TaxID=1108764 RepID=A0ACC2JU46_9PEZI|nr:hypothetical protein O1611_g2563 [Lasiodiplodia mahajangana]
MQSKLLDKPEKVVRITSGKVCRSVPSDQQTAYGECGEGACVAPTRRGLIADGSEILMAEPHGLGESSTPHPARGVHISILPPVWGSVWPPTINSSARIPGLINRDWMHDG